MFNRFLHAFFNFASTLLSRRVLLGLENIPPSGPYILVVNHLSYLDLPFVFGVLGGANVTGWAAEKYQSHLFIGPLLKLAGGIFIQRGQVDRHAIAQAVAWLQRGNIFGMAPEGTRSKTKKLARAKTGAAYLAHEAAVPLIPVGIYGTERVWESWRRLRRPLFTMRVGKPFMLEPIDPKHRHSRLRADTDEIMCRIAALIPSHYHGYYADHPLLQEMLSAQLNTTS